MTCCKSGEADQRVCKVGDCVSGLMKCQETFSDDATEAAEAKLTNPKAMLKIDEGKYEGNCGVALQNHVEGKVCCTDGLEKMAVCVQKEVPDYTSCKTSWNELVGVPT